MICVVAKNAVTTTNVLSRVFDGIINGILRQCENFRKRESKSPPSNRRVSTFTEIYSKNHLVTRKETFTMNKSRNLRIKAEVDQAWPPSQPWKQVESNCIFFPGKCDGLFVFQVTIALVVLLFICAKFSPLNICSFIRY